MVIHEYVGFQYRMEFENGLAVRAVPIEGQHRAAYKEKHRMAALETYRQENQR